MELYDLIRAVIDLELKKAVDFGSYDFEWDETPTITTYRVKCYGEYLGSVVVYKLPTDRGYLSFETNEAAGPETSWMWLELLTDFEFALESAGIWPGTRSDQAEPAARPTRKVGRSRFPENEWAYKQVNEMGRPPGEVYQEWLKRAEYRLETLASPRDSFYKAIKPRKQT